MASLRSHHFLLEPPLCCVCVCVFNVCNYLSLFYAVRVYVYLMHEIVADL